MADEDSQPSSGRWRATGLAGETEARSGLETMVETASIDELRRAYRLVIGSEGVYWERNLITGEIWFSGNFFEMFGIPPDTHEKSLWRLIHREDRGEFRRRYIEAVASIGPLNVDLRHLHRDGSYRWMRLQGRVWAGADGAAERVIGTANDVDAEKMAQIGLQRMTEHFHRAMEASHEVHFERSAEGGFFMSRQVLSLLGHAPDRAAPTREEFLSWVHPDDLPGLQQATRHSELNPGPWACDYRLRLSSGDYRWFRARGRTEVSRKGKVRVTGLIGDIHEQRMAREELIENRRRLQEMVEERTASLELALAETRRQREHAERANEAKSTFLAHMSHEIRTPLNGLLGLNELALREAGGPQLRRYLKLAQQAGNDLLDMLNDVLDFSRLNAEALHPKAEDFDLAEVLASSMRRVMPQARSKDLGMMYDYVGPVTLVNGDAHRLQQIAANLLTNAVKYTDTGHIALHARVRALDGQRCIAEIEFSDTGPGMSAEVAQRVFDPFVQGDDSLARKHGGSGLGLSIARGLSHSMGGDLWLETAPGEGARFHLQLPLQMQPGTQPMDLLPDPGNAWLVYTRRVPAEWLAKRLLRLGWDNEIMNMSELLDRASGLATRAEPPPDMVILAEAALDGPDSLHALRAQLPFTPCVLLVRPDWNQPQIEAAARAVDMPLVFMPITPGALLELTVMHGRASNHVDSSFAELSPPAGPGADVLIAEDNPVNQLIITEIMTALRLRPRLAVDGSQAVAACLEQAPDLVLMDLQMPVVDGIEATRQLIELQRQGRLATFPIVALTAHATPQDRERCLGAGMQGYLTKPISLAQLRIELGRWLKL